MKQRSPTDTLRLVGLAVLAATPALMVVSREATPVLAALVALCFAVASAVDRDGTPRRGIARFAVSFAGILLAGGLILMAASLTWSTAPARGAAHFAHVLGSVLLIAVILACAPERARNTLPAWMCAGLLAAAAAVLASLATDGALKASLGLQAESFRLNRAAVALVLAAPLALTLAWRQGRKPLVVAAAFAAAAAVAASESWSAKIALLAMLIVWPLAALAPAQTHRVLGGIVVASVLVTPLFAGHVNAMLPTAVHDFVGYGSLTIRGEIWREYAALYWQRPLFGFGMEASHALVGTPYVAGLEQRQQELLNFGHPHNAPLQIWFELGAVGALLLAALLALAFRAMERLPPALLPIASITALGVYAVAYVSHGAWQAWWFCLVGLVAGCFAAVRREVVTAPDDAALRREYQTQ